MAALYEGYTLCGLVPGQNLSTSGIQGIEEERDSDHVVVTDSTRSVTLYKVSDQKPLGNWTVKQGQTLTCPTVFNSQTNEYITVSDNKVIRIWKAEDIMLDKAFKATVSTDVWRVHCPKGGEAVTLFQRGAIRLLDPLLSAPQQPIEDVLQQEETIRWSTCLVADAQTIIIFTTEMKGDNFLYLQRLKQTEENSFQKYRLEEDDPVLSPISFSACYRDKHICLLYLYPNGNVYQSMISIHGSGIDEGTQAVRLPRSLVLSLPVGEDPLKAASAMVLDDAHVAVVGVPHPSAGAGKDFLCIWNTNFQTLQAGKEIVGKIYGQLWSYSNKLFIPHGKFLSVIPFACPTSSLASALGKLRQANTEDLTPPALVPSWNNILHGETAYEQPTKAIETRKTRTSRKTQSTLNLTGDQILELIKTAPLDEVQRELEGFLSKHNARDLQPSFGQLALNLVSRSLADQAFYTPCTLAQLVRTQCLSHSVCPDLIPLALDRRDYFLCQLCLQFFHDIPEAITCTCLKAFLSLSDVDAEKLNIEPDSLSFMEALILKEHSQVGLQNGFKPSSEEMDLSDANDDQQTSVENETVNSLLPNICPVGSHKAALLNEIVQTAYSETFLLPPLKDLSSHHVLLFLKYLQFLYLKYSRENFSETPGFRFPSIMQITTWICMLIDAHFTVLVMTPEAKELVENLLKFVRAQAKLFSELEKINGNLDELRKMNSKQDFGQYSIEVIELF